ncbi:MAG: hypothetical protein HOU81_27545 [Hamadaea sp.]|uniref:hypothetical protein n=1 Tax=Hamadaea sp. TaxID=2024425 RepID=UPI0017944F10|nr:hypothetical protein [Hamadaea sp.]NUR74582.1 hypothetical protein [Hamadaea sp.]NUT17705.1 hypothetical protein [Hamadaea sp.]
MTAPAAITGDFVPAGPARGPRPATVTIGAAFQAVAVVLLLALIALAWISRAQYDGFADEAARLVSARPDELAAEHTSNLIMAVVVSVLAGVPALWFGSTLWPLFRGANVARILAAVGAFAIPGLGILLVIGSCVSGMFLVFFLASAPFEEDPNMVDDYPDDFGDFSGTPFQEKLWDLQSSAAFDWAGLMPVLALLIVAALTVSAIMYVLPPTNRWYNPARAVARGRPYPVPVYYPVYYPYPGPPPVAPPVAPLPDAQLPVEPPSAEPPTS